MKNKIKILLVIIIVFFPIKISNSNEFELKSENIIVKENGNLIEAKGDVEVITNNNIEIMGENAKLNKEKSILEIFGNVILKDNDKDLEIKSQYMVYNKKEDIIFIKGNTYAKLDGRYNIKSKNLYYNNSKKIIFSDEKSELKDNRGNKITVSKFNLNLDSNLAKLFGITFEDQDKNIFNLNEAFLDIANDKIVGKDIKLNFDKNIFGNEENDPRLYGNSMISDENTTIINKGVFTSCKIRENDKCPPWMIKAEEVKHDKKKKIINYKNAWLNIYDIPVFYFPKFYHPDPSVKRQSGFLMPKLINSNFLGSSLQIPYYNVISSNKDFTISPRVFFNDKFLVQSEYRQVNQYSKTFLDHSLNKTSDSTNTHFFGNFESQKDSGKFEINIETTSNKNYLKKYNIKSPLLNNNSELNSFISLEKDTEEQYFFTSLEVYEDLTKIDSDSYEYIYPNYVFTKNLENSYNGNLGFFSSGYQKKYDTNRYDAVNINDIIYNSKQHISKKGFINDFSYIIKNVNTDGSSSLNYKNSFDNKLLSKIVYNSKLPLIKRNTNNTKYFTPKMSLSFSPSETKNINSNDNRIKYLDLFALNRVNSDDMIEGGESLTLGIESRYDNSLNQEIFSLSVGQVYRFEENPDLPIISSIGNKRSDFIGKLKFSPTDLVDLNYSFSADKDLEKTNYNFLETVFKTNNFNTTFGFLEDNSFLGEKSFISNETKYKFNDNYSLGFSTNKNLDKNLTEYYDLIYEYKNDCLTAAIKYEKSFYQDADLSKEESLFFTIKFVPLGNVYSPSLN